ncbi:hypothetical protein BH20ACT15_BH20ACT15_04160 [soil metagenome]
MFIPDEIGVDGMANRPRTRKQSWMRSQSDGFRPIKQVGVAVAFGVPLLGMGLFVLFAAILGGSTFLWILALGLIVVGLVTAGSGRIV